MTTPNVTLVCPSGQGSVVGRSGVIYVPDANNLIYVPQGSGDIVSLLDAGFIPESSSASGTGVAGLKFPIRLPLMNAINADGSRPTASPATVNFGTTVTVGTSEYLTGANAKSATITSKAYWEIVLPSNYIAGDNLTVKVQALYTGTGTVGTKTYRADAYLAADDGTHGATIIATTAATLGTTATTSPFVVTGTTLYPGARVIVGVTVALQETGGSNNLASQVNSVVIY